MGYNFEKNIKNRTGYSKTKIVIMKEHKEVIVFLKLVKTTKGGLR